MITRRTALLGLLVTPAIVRASSLDFVPRYTYVAYDNPNCSLIDLVRSDGKLVGWIQPWEIRNGALRSPQQILREATLGITENTRLMAAAEFGIYGKGRLPTTLRQIAEMHAF